MVNVSHVTKKYGKVLACNDVSFHLDPGSVTVLLGPNGAGARGAPRGYQDWEICAFSAFIFPR